MEEGVCIGVRVGMYLAKEITVLTISGIAERNGRVCWHTGMGGDGLGQRDYSF